MSGPTILDTAAPLLEQHPRLRDAMQPAPCEPIGAAIDPARNSGLFGMDDRWRRRLTATPAGLVGPILVEGSCMPTLFPSGLAALWVDPDVQPEPGDMLLLRYGDADLEQMIADGRRSAAWMAEYGSSQLGTALLKQLVEIDGHRYLAAEDGGLRYGGSRVLGVLRWFVEIDSLDPAAILMAIATKLTGVRARHGDLASMQRILARATGADSPDSRAETAG